MMVQSPSGSRSEIKIIQRKKQRKKERKIRVEGKGNDKNRA
jgi:hypothetical protein